MNKKKTWKKSVDDPSCARSSGSFLPLPKSPRQALGQGLGIHVNRCGGPNPLEVQIQQEMAHKSCGWRPHRCGNWDTGALALRAVAGNSSVCAPVRARMCVGQSVYSSTHTCICGRKHFLGSGKPINVKITQTTDLAVALLGICPVIPQSTACVGKVWKV